MGAVTILGVRPGANADTLSCAAANLESLLTFAGVTDTLTPLAAPCTADVTSPDRLRLSPVPLAQWLTRTTGLTLERWTASTADEVLQFAADVVMSGRPVLVHADAYTVPWNPYCGHEHHAHAFVVDGVDDNRLHMIDGYTNATRYGTAAPIELWMKRAELAAVLAPPPDERWAVEQLTGAARATQSGLLTSFEIITANVRVRAEAEAAGRGLASLAAWADKDHIAGLNLAIWLLTRSRTAHERWWHTLNPATTSVDGGECVAAWKMAQTLAYIAWRRVTAGKPCPTSIADAVLAAADAEERWFTQMAEWAQPRSTDEGRFSETPNIESAL
ncbi:hypothetical protein JNW91_01535 [Micromonospora sp. STR1_7]|uniref:Butirosin biosynthesis protein H N-terminal domain-containing protein n=1 Tax=Micromonospora parastrephiae TaxID=2806101 RepID=A0ABS1XN28_9ACTN|nr:BtrH N-terminal domain-containing protein [Micromonospora parastrephiae]MBM0230672.1 hypothetical protein [Micromonospora parastrephiae]